MNKPMLALDAPRAIINMRDVLFSSPSNRICSCIKTAVFYRRAVFLHTLADGSHAILIKL